MRLGSTALEGEEKEEEFSGDLRNAKAKLESNSLCPALTVRHFSVGGPVVVKESEWKG